MRPELERDLVTAKTYFEEMIGCLVGCGCWEPGWDRSDRVASFAGSGFSWAGAPSPADVLAALERVCAIDASELEDAASLLELHLPAVEALVAFWQPSIATLRDALRPPPPDERSS